MIVSASRRTDIPAFYGDWLFERIRQGYALVRNPFNSRLVYRVPISAERTRCIVFWTKNPGSLIGRIEELESFGIPFYFLFTITGYGPELERNLPDKAELLRSFLSLSRRLGPDRVVWRYDPILFTSTYTPAEHLRLFGALAQRLSGFTGRCILSYLTMYNKCRRNLEGFDRIEVSPAARRETIEALQELASGHGIELSSCACTELADSGVPAGKCVDDGLISRITARTFSGRKDRSQRDSCLCVESADIGAYDTCLHHCLYCYANSNYAAAQRRRRLHDPESPLLIGKLGPQDRVMDRGNRGSGA